MHEYNVQNANAKFDRRESLEYWLGVEEPSCALSHVCTIQVAGGAGSYTNPQTRPAKTAVVANAAQLQSSGGPLLSSPPKPVDQTWTKTKPARPANLQPRNLATVSAATIDVSASPQSHPSASALLPQSHPPSPAQIVSTYGDFRI